MHTKIFTFALVATLSIALAGCGEEKPRRAARKSTPSETSSKSTANDKPAAPSETSATPAESAAAVPTGDWGTLKGKFVYSGPAPKPKPLDVNKDQDVCSKHPLVDESVVVGDEGAMANVVVWIRPAKGQELKVHPDYDALKSKPVVIDNHQCRFDPHVMTYWTGQPFVVKNSDPIGHNTNATFQVNASFNEIIPAEKDSTRQPLESPESIPAPIACNIHPWMKGWLVVQPHPYMAVSGKDGSFEIKNIPTGVEFEFIVWQEASGYVQKAEIDGKDAGWAIDRAKNKRYAFKQVIKPGDNDLGTIKLEPAQFNK